MSVIITEMNVPMSCLDCPMYNWNCCGLVHKSALDYYIEEGYCTDIHKERLPICPLIDGEDIGESECKPIIDENMQTKSLLWQLRQILHIDELVASQLLENIEFMNAMQHDVVTKKDICSVANSLDHLLDYTRYRRLLMNDLQGEINLGHYKTEETK